MAKVYYHKFLAVLAVLGVLVGLAGRCLILGISFEYDEIFTAISANPAVSFPYIWTHYLMVDVHPPLYNFLLWVYNHVVPYGPEWVLRWPSWIFSVTALFLSWKLFPRYLGKTAQWLFVLLLSCNFYMLLYAQHARVYSWLVCLSVPFTFLYLQIARRSFKGRSVPREWWIWYGVFAVLLCWSHYFGALLYGLFSVVLFVLAWKYKRPLRVFTLVPLLVLICFLPWLVPNLLYNLSEHRFTGNWWGNQTPLSWHLVRLWVEFFFTSLKAFYVLIGIGVLGIIYSILRMRKTGVWPYRREIVLLFVPMAAAGIFVLAVSFKIFWLLWRYFMPFVPSLYLLVALVIAPICKRYKEMFLVFLCFVGLSYQFFLKARPFFWQDHFFPARAAMEIYKGAFPEKDLYVVALEAFPPQSMTPMYAFYPQTYFGMKQSVYELFHLPQQEREELLAQRAQALLWMPNCYPLKIDRLAQSWQRSVHIFGNFKNTCFLLVADDLEQPIDRVQLADYAYRFNKYMQLRTRVPNN